MQELVKIQVKWFGEKKVNAVDGRELHGFLEVATRFDKWIERRIAEYKFVVNSDFCPILAESSGGRPSTEYALSIDMAKALCVAEANEKGKMLLKEIVSKSVVTLKEMMDFAKKIDIDEPDMFVYAMMEEDTGKVKIGISKDPERRLKQLQTGNSSRLVLVATHKAENGFADERALHHKNEAYRIHGEWFSNEAKNSISI